MSSADRSARWTVRELLNWTQGRFSELSIEDPRVDAEHLLAHALECSRIELYLQHDRLLDEGERAGFRALVKRRLAREPVAYIEGLRGFHALDLDLAVDPRALIPRPETEHLVDWLLEQLPPAPAPLMEVLDIGTGSGAIALAVAKARHELRVTAVDISEDALALARHNAERLELRDQVRFVRSDGLAAIERPAQGLRAIAANLPYIPSAELAGLAPEVRCHEPRLALDGGPDGLRVIRQVLDEICRERSLASGGWLYLELGVGQAAAVEELLRAAGLVEVSSRRDYAQIPRIVGGRAP